MNGLHQGDKSTKRQLGNARETGLQNNGESAHLQGEYTAQDRGGDDPCALSGSALPEQMALHDRPPDQIIADETPVKGHVPYVGAQGHEASIGKEEALNGQDHDHGKKTGLRSQQGGEHHAAAHMS